MQKFSFTFYPSNRDINPIVIVTPADGPSLGIAPDGKCK